MDFVTLYGVQLDAELGTTDTTQRFTTARRKVAINEAQTEWIERTECLVKEFTEPVVNSDEEYDLEAEVANYMRIATQGPSLRMTVTATGDVRYVEGPKDFPQKDPVLRNRQSPGWRAAADGTPNGWYLRRDAGSLFFGLNPPPSIPSTETWDLLIPCIVRAVDMSADADLPFKVSGGTAPAASLHVWHKALVHHAAFLLEKLRKDPQRMKLQAELFESYVQRYQRQNRPRGGMTVQLAHNYRAGRGGVRRMSVNGDAVV